MGERILIPLLLSFNCLLLAVAQDITKDCRLCFDYVFYHHIFKFRIMHDSSWNRENLEAFLIYDMSLTFCMHVQFYSKVWIYLYVLRSKTSMTEIYNLTFQCKILMQFKS